MDQASGGKYLGVNSDAWTSGLCCVFANALRERFDLQMRALMVRAHSDDFETLVHAYVALPDGRAVDALGVCAEAEIRSRYDGWSDADWRSVACLSSPEDQATGYSVECRDVDLSELWDLNPEDHEDTAAALAYVDENPERFADLHQLKLDRAAEDYWKEYARQAKGQASDLTDDLLAKVRSIREGFRNEEGGGGMCHLVTDHLEATLGWRRLSVSKVDGFGDVICAAHYVSILSDGTIVDPTADQFGGADDIRIIRLGEPGYGDYRPEFYEDFDPDQFPYELGSWSEYWSGELDCDAQTRLIEDRGAGWWLKDKQKYFDYLSEQATLARKAGWTREAQYVERLVERGDNLEMPPVRF